MSANSGNLKRSTMRTTLIACALVLFTASAFAQSQPTIEKVYRCAVMSDSMRTALGLTTEQMTLVKDADERYRKASELSGDEEATKLDEAAMHGHDSDMKAILTTEQYVNWKAMCSEVKAQAPATAPLKY
jgi:hypothetical protein